MSQEFVRTAVMIGIVGLLMVRRVRRQIGRQPVRPKMIWARIVLLGVLSATFVTLVVAGGHVPWALAGVAPGVLLGVYALSRTSFETNAEGRFYTPNPWIGLAVSALLVGRMVVRIATANAATPGAMDPSNPFASIGRNPLTLGLFFLLVGYQVTYLLGVLRRSPKAPPAEAAAPAPLAA